MKEHATNAVVKRGMDEMFMPTALQDLKQTKEHHDDLSKQIQAFGQQIGAPTPADHRQAHLDLGTALGLAIASIAGKLTAMKDARDAAKRGGGREIVVVKAATVDTELARLGLTLRRASGGRRMVSPDAFDAGSAAGEALSIVTGIDAA